MKTKLLALLFLALASFQNLYSQELSHSIMTGINVLSFTDADGNRYEPSCGFNIGVSTHLSLGDRSALSLDCIYSRQSAKAEFSSGEYSISSDTKLNYIYFPLLHNIYIFKGFAIKYGVQYQFLLSGSQILKNVSSSGAVAVENSSDADKINATIFSSTSYAIPIGVSYEFAEKVILDARYIFGVSNIYNENYGYSAGNNLFSLSIGYKF